MSYVWYPLVGGYLGQYSHSSAAENASRKGILSPNRSIGRPHYMGRIFGRNFHRWPTICTLFHSLGSIRSSSIVIGPPRMTFTTSTSESNSRSRTISRDIRVKKFHQYEVIGGPSGCLHLLKSSHLTDLVVSMREPRIWKKRCLHFSILASFSPGSSRASSGCSSQSRNHF